MAFTCSRINVNVNVNVLPRGINHMNSPPGSPNTVLAVPLSGSRPRRWGMAGGWGWWMVGREMCRPSCPHDTWRCALFERSGRNVVEKAGAASVQATIAARSAPLPCCIDCHFQMWHTYGMGANKPNDSFVQFNSVCFNSHSLNSVGRRESISRPTSFSSVQFSLFPAMGDYTSGRFISEDPLHGVRGN